MVAISCCNFNTDNFWLLSETFYESGPKSDLFRFLSVYSMWPSWVGVYILYMSTSSSWHFLIHIWNLLPNMKKDFYLDIYTILNPI